MMQVGNVLLKSAHAYYSAARSFGFKSIWCYLPEPFQVRNRRMEAACNPFAAFLSTQTEIKLLVNLFSSEIYFNPLPTQYPNGVKSENYDALSHTRPDCPYISLVHLQTLYNEFLMAEDITIKEKKINEELYRNTLRIFILFHIFFWQGHISNNTASWCKAPNPVDPTWREHSVLIFPRKKKSE